MKIFLSSLETYGAKEISEQCAPMKWNLMSYYYLRKSDPAVIQQVIDRSELIEIDSGAHSFQKGKKVDWDVFTDEYAQWIKENDCDKIIGYFEMDVDNVIGYEKVLELRKKLEAVSDKIIPVWHKNRGIKEFKKMCQDYAGKIVAITGFKNEDIQDDQYIEFLKYAWKWGCELHCLGMTRKDILNKVPFDYVDSSSWRQGVLYGRIENRRLKNPAGIPGTTKIRIQQFIAGYRRAMKMQDYYYRRWSLPSIKLKEKLKNERNPISD